MKMQTYTDGGSRGNPGPSALGVIVKQNGKTIRAFGEYMGIRTNNQAEYTAVMRALETAKDLGATEVECVMDSELVVKQMNGLYRVKNPELAQIYLRIVNLTRGFKRVTFRHVMREHNTEADAEVNKAIDQHLSTRGQSSLS